ncbi:MAG: glycosyltransferase, partial [bacterium]|nr:glycosyltransferase [bacterium]
DWMATHRIRYQVQTLLKEGADICGLDTLFFFEPSAQKAWQYIYPGSEKPWLAGGTFCYTKNAWKKDPFPDINEGEDTRFVWGDSFNKIVALQDNTFYAALIHKGNTSEKCTNDIRWHSLPIKRIRSLMGKDFRFYRSLLPLDTNTGRPAKEEPAALTPLKGEIPVYSILMVVHNALEIVKMSVMRTLRYLPDDARLIVVDNASNDGTRQFLELCASKESIQLIRVERNIGHGPGLELARRDIRSPYIVTLDSDAFPLCANWLSQLRHRLNAQTKVAGILHHRDYIHPSCLMIARSTLEDFDLSFPDEKNRPSQLDVAERISVEIKGRGFKIAGLQKTAGRRRGSISEPVYLGSSYEGIVYHQWYTTRAFLTGGQKVDDVPTEAIEDSMQEVLEEYHNEFREITVVLGIRATASQPRRLANALAALRALHLQTLERLRYRVVVVEQDRSPNLKESLLPFCDRYIFAHNPGPYNRSWGFNIGAVRSMGKTGAFCFVDADLLVPPDFLSCCLHEIKSGARAVLPYNEVLYLDAASTLKAVRDRLRTRPFNPHDYKGDIFSLSVGGVVWVEPALYFDIGGHNEDFRGWGWEDREFLNRLTQKTTIKRLPRRLLHLYHSPTAMLEANATDNEILYETLLKEPPASAKTAIGNPNRYTPEPPMRDIKQNIQGKRDWENWYKWSDERIKDIVQDERQRKQGHSLRARIFQTVVQLAVPPRWEEAPPRGEEAPLHGEEAPPHGEGPPSHGEGARVLEVGCGPGAFRHYLRRYQGALQPGRESITWIGMDITYKMLKTTREFFPEALLCNADAGALPFADNSFDVVFINHVLEHLPPWLMECTLKEALRTASKNVVLGFFIPPVHSGSHKVNRVGENFIDTQWTARELETIIRENHWILHEQLDIRAGDGENNTLWTLMPADVENKSKVKISIVMPTYKRSHSIFRTVDLIRRQSFTDWELIVVDNDGCTRYDFDDPRIRVYCHNSRSSASYARNKGLQYATGELVCFFDDDDDMFPDYLERFAHAFRQNPNAKMVRCGMIVTGGKTNYSYATPECWLRRQFATPTWRDDGLEQDQNYFCRLIRQNRWEEEKGDIVVIQKALCRANADPRGGLRIGNY